MTGANATFSLSFFFFSIQMVLRLFNVHARVQSNRFFLPFRFSHHFRWIFLLVVRTSRTYTYNSHNTITTLSSCHIPYLISFFCFFFLLLNKLARAYTYGFGINQKFMQLDCASVCLVFAANFSFWCALCACASDSRGRWSRKKKDFKQDEKIDKSTQVAIQR